eukprot:TRINITY_DN16708_c0_g1_i1.p1 TRINITY_DN16708_c0_g1~~TRINITY_DN16708_c0_g1_i1.p1  ORF type:complete len:328 (-),score=15.19 TRINITY_DN16708_c0_g1_i1:66-1049(-)
MKTLPVSWSEAYNLPFVHPPRPQLVCAACTFVAFEAVRAEPCGHLFCESCLRSAVQATQHCPACKKPCNELGICRDPQSRLEISHLLTKCPFDTHHAGCAWQGQLSALNHHLAGCPQARRRCQACGLRLLPRALIRHCVETRKHPDYCKRDCAAVQIQALARGWICRKRFVKDLHLSVDKHLISDADARRFEQLWASSRAVSEVMDEVDTSTRAADDLNQSLRSSVRSDTFSPVTLHEVVMGATPVPNDMLCFSPPEANSGCSTPAEEVEDDPEALIEPEVYLSMPVQQRRTEGSEDMVEFLSPRSPSTRERKRVMLRASFQSSTTT